MIETFPSVIILPSSFAWNIIPCSDWSLSRGCSLSSNLENLECGWCNRIFTYLIGLVRVSMSFDFFECQPCYISGLHLEGACSSFAPNFISLLQMESNYLLQILFRCSRWNPIIFSEQYSFNIIVSLSKLLMIGLMPIDCSIMLKYLNRFYFLIKHIK